MKSLMNSLENAVAVISVTLLNVGDLIENIASKLHKPIRSHTITLIEVQHIRLIVGIHNQQAGIVECCLMLLLRAEGDGTVGGESHGSVSLITL